MGSKYLSRRRILVGSFLGLLTLAVYWPVTRHGFVILDDPIYVTQNAQVQAGISYGGIIWAFQTFSGGNWHPLTWLSHMLDCQWFGLDASRHHFTNLVLHTVNAILLFLLVQRMTQVTGKSAFVAALFALHPLHVESVAWVSERKDLLSALFGLFSCYAYLRYVEKDGQTAGRKQRWYLLAIACFILSPLSKPMLVTLPFILLLLDFWPLGRTRLFGLGEQSNPVVFEKTGIAANRTTRSLPFLLLEKWPFFGLAAVFSVSTVITQKQAGAMALMQTVPLGSRLANAVVAYCRYGLKMFWPVDLAAFYPFPNAWPAELVLGCGIFLCATTFIVVRFWKRFPYLAVGWFLFIGMLVPVIGLVQVGLQSMADRYTYLPLTGLFVAFTWGVCDLVSRWRHAGTALRVAAILVLVACSHLTAKQTRYWENSEMLFAHALAVTSDNAVAQSALAGILARAGRFDEAFPHYVEAVRIKPDYWEVFSDLGLMLVMRGRLDEGIIRFRDALRAGIDTAEVHLNLASALVQKGDLDEAISEFKTALRIKPVLTQARWELASALTQRGKLAEAKTLCAEVLQREPENADAHIALGRVCAAERDFDKALHHLTVGVRLRVNDAEAHVELGKALVTAGRPDEARANFQKALALRPDMPSALNQWAQTLALSGNVTAAISALETAVRLAPEDAIFHNNLALLLVQCGKVADAVTHFSEAVRLRSNAEAHYRLAAALVLQGRSETAVFHLREAILQKPDWSAALNDLAWILATHPQAAARDGSEAVRLAEKACQLTLYREPQFVGTLAATYAEAGRFEEAVNTGERAHELAMAAGLKELADRNAQLTKEYRAHHPHRESSPPPAASSSGKP